MYLSNNNNIDTFYNKNNFIEIKDYKLMFFD